MVHNLGFDIETDANFRKDAYLFGESQSRILITISPDREDELINQMNAHNVSFTRLGEVTGDRVTIDEVDFGAVREWKTLHEDTLSQKLDNQ
jgi:phosphoribosylformylglycinamidine synthase